MKHDDPNLIVRYSANERTNHWITAITFVLLALSGLALFHPSMFWLTALFGGGQWTRILHPFVGLVMFVSFAILVVRFWHCGAIDHGCTVPESVARHLADVSPRGIAACASSRHVFCIRQSVEYDRESRQPFDTPDPKSVGGRAASGRVDPAC